MNWIKRIFISPAELRLRAGWRLLLQTLLMGVIAFALGFAYLALPETWQRGGAGLMLNQFAELVVITLSVYLARRFLDRRSFISLGVKFDRQAWRDLGWGILITGVMMGLIYLLEWAFGWVTFHGFAWQFEPAVDVLRKAGLMVVVFILVGWNEELLSRGYHLQTVASGLNLGWGVVLSSAVFGLLHLGNPNATWVSVAGIFLAGVFMAYGYIRTGRLWLPIGLHIGWNTFEGVIFGFPVSGLDIYPLMRISVAGPELLTGGAFGPEAGLVLLPAMVVGFAAIWWLTGANKTDLNLG